MTDKALKDEPSEEVDQPEAGNKSGKSDRDRSTIQFPYLPLEEALAIAKGVHELNGSSCQIDQLAAHLNQKPDTGSFRLKLGVSKLFGLTSHSLGTVTLTALGSRICDPQQEPGAKADAFLNIPLYQKVYEQFKGGILPPAAGLETAMVAMGVAPKQKATARQVFQRSAVLAGFFWSGENRLVRPPIKGTAIAPVGDINGAKAESDQDFGSKVKGSSGGAGGGLHPLIDGLLQKLPQPDEEWSLEARRKWLQTASHNFDLIFKGGDDTRSIKVNIEKEGS